MSARRYTFAARCAYALGLAQLGDRWLMKSIFGDKAEVSWPDFPREITLHSFKGEDSGSNRGES